MRWLPLFVCAAAAVAVAGALGAMDDSKHTVADFSRSFRGGRALPAERAAALMRSVAAAKSHNARAGQSWVAAELNEFSDWLPEELARMRNVGVRNNRPVLEKGEKSHAIPYPFAAADIDLAALPASVDWREKGVVTPVKNQGQCGSCWTFGTAESIESAYAIKTGHLFTLSEQQVLDCTPNPNDCGGQGGCKGGTPQIAYEEIIKKGGLSTEWTYPYISYYGAGQQCRFNTSLTVPEVKLSGYYQVPTNEYAPLMHAVANMGPLAITVDASTWFKYDHGVFDGCNQTSPTLDHSVILVGYGTDHEHGDYWLVRNSWGPTWGENGYIRLKRSSSWNCGWDDHQSEGDECNHGPIERVCGTCGVWVDAVFPLVTVRA